MYRDPASRNFHLQDKRLLLSYTIWPTYTTLGLRGEWPGIWLSTAFVAINEQGLMTTLSITISDSLWFGNVITGLICIFKSFFISQNISKTYIASEAIEQPLSSLEHSFPNARLPSKLGWQFYGSRAWPWMLVVTRKILPKLKIIEVHVPISWSEKWWFEENQPIGPPYPIKPQYCIYGLLNRKPKLFSLIL